MDHRIGSLFLALSLASCAAATPVRPIPVSISGPVVPNPPAVVERRKLTAPNDAAIDQRLDAIERNLKDLHDTLSSPAH